MHTFHKLYVKALGAQQHGVYLSDVSVPELQAHTAERTPKFDGVGLAGHPAPFVRYIFILVD